MPVEYLRDSVVDEALDRELRALLSACFTGAHNERFRHQRFYHEMPRHRWLVRERSGRLMAHLAVHDKVLGSTAGDLRVGGVAEVCVDAAHRGQGLVREMLIAAHDWMLRQGTPFAVLFGDKKVYGSSGYEATGNPLRRLSLETDNWTIEPMSSFLIKPLGEISWPEGLIDLRGPVF